jgi:hypothetical protein
MDCPLRCLLAVVSLVRSPAALTQLNECRHDIGDTVVASLEEHQCHAEIEDSDVLRTIDAANVGAKICPEIGRVGLRIKKRCCSPVGMGEFAEQVVLVPEAFHLFVHAVDKSEDADGLGHDVRIGSAPHRQFH